MNIGIILHFFAIAIASGITTMGIAYGQYLAVDGYMLGINRQGAAAPILVKLLFYGLLATELSFILSFVIGMIMMQSPIASLSNSIGITEIAIAVSLLAASTIIAIAVGNIIRAGSQVLSRLPQHESKLFTTFIVLLAFTETPMLLCFIIALMGILQLSPEMTINQAFKLASASLAMGFGSIGPSLAQIIFINRVCSALSFRFKNFSKIMSFAFSTEILIETSVLMVFMISLFLTITRVNPAFDTIYTKFIFLAIAFTMTCGSFGSSVSIGYFGSHAIKQASLDMKNYDFLFKNSILTQILIETYGILSFIIALISILAVTVF